MNTTNQKDAMSVLRPSFETRELFLSFIRQSYFGIRQLKFKKYHKGWQIRAQYGSRELHVRGYTYESAVAHFMNEIKRKVIQEPFVPDRYYRSLDRN